MKKIEQVTEQEVLDHMEYVWSAKGVARGSGASLKKLRDTQVEYTCASCDRTFWADGWIFWSLCDPCFVVYNRKRMAIRFPSGGILPDFYADSNKVPIAKDLWKEGQEVANE